MAETLGSAVTEQDVGKGSISDWSLTPLGLWAAAKNQSLSLDRTVCVCVCVCACAHVARLHGQTVKGMKVNQSRR